MSNITRMQDSVPQRYKDLGDGGYAQVVALDGGVTISSVTVSDVEISNDVGNPIPVAPGVNSIFPVSGSAAAGTPPSMPPLSVSGIDGSGNKQHFRTDTSGNQGVYGAATRSTATATIANGASVSGSVDLTNTALLGFIAPAGWTTAALNLEVSMDNASWSTGIYDGSGSAVSSWSALVAGAGYAVDTVSMLPFRYVRFRSGTSASPVNQAAQRDFVVITRPLA